MSRKQSRQVLILVSLLYLILYIAGSSVRVQAESGAVYSCTINRSYGNPVTGEIEDSGGESSYATGQGMVESAVYSQGLMEVTDSGNYYLTLRLSLLDYTSGHTFAVQNVGDSGWMDTSTAVTANGSDGNGSTADVCMQVPSENCIVRITMYVTPMGRNTVFYVYPTNYCEGNSVGMNPYFVTESGANMDTSSGNEDVSGYAGNSDGTSQNYVNNGNSYDGSSYNNSTAGSSQGQTMQQNTAGNGTQTGTSQANVSETDTNQKETDQSAKDGDDKNQNTKDENSENQSDQEQKNGTEDSAEGVTSQTSADSDSDAELNNVQGLSLSTAVGSSSSVSQKTTGEISVSPYFMLGLTIVISGLILILAAALVVWYFRKNWRRWGGEDDYDEED